MVEGGSLIMFPRELDMRLKMEKKNVQGYGERVGDWNESLRAGTETLPERSPVLIVSMYESKMPITCESLYNG